MFSSASIAIPATTANLGPGFDSFGVALNIFNQVTIRKTTTPTKIPLMAEKAADSFFKETHQKPFPFSLTIIGDVPHSRGLGSSVTVRLGVLMGLNQMLSSSLSSSVIYELCAALEGHPDNVAAAILGGFTIARRAQPPLRYDISPELFFVLLIPDFEISTHAARQHLPSSIPIADAAANAADAAVIAAAFATQNYHLLRGAFQDRLHQPFRTSLIPFLPEVITTAEKAGALGGWLSGSGSTIAMVTLGKKSAIQVAAALQQSFSKSKIVITTANNDRTEFNPDISFRSYCGLRDLDGDYVGLQLELERYVQYSSALKSSSALSSSHTAAPRDELARIFHHSRDEEAAKADGIRQAPNLDDGCMYPYSPSPSSSLTQYPSAFPASAVEKNEISGLI